MSLNWNSLFIDFVNNITPLYDNKQKCNLAEKRNYSSAFVGSNV